MDEQRLAIPDSLERAVAAVRALASFAFIGWGRQVKGVFVLCEQIRPETPRALEECRRLGVRPIVLTGDASARAARLETELDTRVLFERLPQDKVAAIELARRGGSVVGMVGDGINDAPALAAADIGIAMGCGADLSRDSAAVCLLSNDLLRLPWTISLARRTVRIIRQNLFWAFIYNIIGIGLAVSGHLNPIWAGVAMVVSSFLVITNSLRLSNFPDSPFVPPEVESPNTTTSFTQVASTLPLSAFDAVPVPSKASATELHSVL
jgi:P-type E1-E2 ATPase